jgi:N-acetyl-gamma-glutamyl-phosphate reductase
VKKTVFVDGQHGTTGLQIRQRLHGRNDIEVIEIPDDKRKDPATRGKLLNEADIVCLCLPDDAAREAVGMITNKSTRVIDGSTAHRVAPDWVYGLPELKKDQRAMIQKAGQVTVPGCHATGFILMLYPLVSQGIVAPDYPVSCQAICGYSGGGRNMIADYENSSAPDYIKEPRPYSLGLNHKHVPEMTKIVGLMRPPLFSPTVVNVYSGEIVSIPLVASYLKKRLTAAQMREVLAEYYDGERFVKVMPYPADDYLKSGFMTFGDDNGSNNLEIFVFGGADGILLSARYDNLGKGASGAAVQNMNIMLGIEEATGLL